MAKSGTPSLKRRSIEGAAWTTVSYFASQALRLGSNLILTRLLAPEHFGLMGIVNVFILGLNMFSDLGLGPNIIQSPRGREPAYLNAAWSVQVLRSGLLWALCLVAGLPLAFFYQQPELVWLIPCAGIATMISGLNSTNFITNNRDLNMFRLTIIDLLAQVISLVAMIGVAVVFPSVWVLVLGAILSSLIKLLAGHFWLPGILNRFVWDPETMKEMLHFGKWIFLSTLLNFAGSSSANLILGKLVSIKELGIYSVASNLASAVEAVYQQIALRVLLPVFSKIISLPIDQLRRRVAQVRLAVMGAFLPLLWVLVLFSNTIVHLLFDNRYQNVDWILRVLALGLVPTIISGIGPFYLAHGDSKLMTKLSVTKLAIYFVAIFAGWFVGQSDGVIVGIGVYTVAFYPFESAAQWKYKIWLPKLDLLGYAATALVLGGGYLLWGLK